MSYWDGFILLMAIGGILIFAYNLKGKKEE